MEAFFTSRIRRYYDVELPQARGRRGRWPLLIALHGYEGDKTSMMALASLITNGRMIAMSLQGHNQFFLRSGRHDPKSDRVGFGWGTSYKMAESIQLHEEGIRWLIRAAVWRRGADPKRVFLLAFSQACAYNYRYVFSHPRSVRGVIAVCGGVPGDWNENPRYRKARTHVLHIAATQDQWYSQEQNLEYQRKLAKRAASVDFRFYESTHRFPRASIPHIRHWIEDHL
jgi:predicted esterase